MRLAVSATCLPRSYTRIIDGILAVADLETVTRKKVRKGLEEAISKDLSNQKDAIKALIEARFDAISNEVAQVPTPTSGAAAGHEINGRSSSADGEIEVSLPPPSKKPKREASSSEEADARLAAELQAQENRLSRGRVTRGGAAGASKPKSKPKPAKKKTPKRVRSDEDSNVEDSEAGAEPKKRKAGGGFQKPFNLSVPLAELCGESQLSRPQVVKKIWEYIKGNELQDPNDKRQILCDEKLHAVFRQDKVNMFSMNKLLGNQLYPIED
ncbi:SWIB-domain-containing protein [Parathielavia appendiculata]|uniref:SWIB-domain-containing protein n=1 Tax=Parathielavia appendiculata TaxID=2587402 RepID=A0AAN6Z4Y6_9PEZI|nr:SWIB-domain-containing protein [Parathielavia appendiculata]